MRAMPRTKIVCTLGPVTRSKEAIGALAEAGMDVVRLNFSHGTHEEHGQAIRWVREVSREIGREIAILQDLCGPKIRIGALATPTIELKPGREVTITQADVEGTPERISCSYKALAREVTTGDRILLADGEVELETLDVAGGDLRCRVVVGGKLTAHKGLNLPTASLTLPAITEKDRKDLKFGVEQGVDFIALSFVRSSADVRLCKTLIYESKGEQPVIAKIEKHEALRNIDDIIAAADGVMVARGDLGVEVALERVPLAQKLIIRRANEAGKPVITATQMLKSMVESPRPTRAEVSDVANAIFEGTDAVMLSEETAAGNYPTRAVNMLTRIAKQIEGDQLYARYRERKLEAKPTLQDVLSMETRDMADKLQVAAIVAPTLSGTTARMISRYRPRQPIFAISPSLKTVRQLALTWGVTAYLGEEQNNTDLLVTQVEEQVLRLGLVAKGDKIVFIGGAPAGRAGTTNFVRIDEIR
ncbi:MAG TPA: pyruvate kinase [Planctomycetota bacterium]|nr:pyruvate kinase [Planctomycetota bacterium]